MRSAKQDAISMPHPAELVFAAALGVVQKAKNTTLLAAHAQGRKLVVREKAKLSNPKFLQVWVQEHGEGAVLQVVVGTDDRTPAALLDGRANQKSLKAFVADVRGALDGSAPAPATPVPDFYLQKQTEVAWVDPDQDPQIQLGGNVLAWYGL